MRASPEVKALRLIISYKLIKSVLQIAFAVLGLILLWRGLGEHIHDLVRSWQAHTNKAWVASFASWLLREASPHHEIGLVALLAGDAVLSAGEAWALHRRYAWAPRAVAILTALPVPYEISRLLFYPSIGRILFLLANLLIVFYLIRVARHVHAVVHAAQV